MKIRNGFVSNSSSSSFVLVGIYSKDDKTKNGLSSLYLDGDDDMSYAIGIKLADSEYLEYGSISIEKINEYSKKVSDILEIPLEDVKLLFGTRPC